MTDRSGPEHSHDVLQVPFLFVPHGGAPPLEWLTRHPDPIKVSARLVPRGSDNGESAQVLQADMGQAVSEWFGRQAAMNSPVTAPVSVDRPRAADATVQNGMSSGANRQATDPARSFFAAQGSAQSQPFGDVTGPAAGVWPGSAKTAAQSRQLGLPVGTGMPVPASVVPSALTDEWHNRSKADKPNHDALGNVEYGAAGAAAGFPLTVLQAAADVLKWYKLKSQDPLNPIAIRSGCKTISSGSKVSTRDYGAPQNHQGKTQTTETFVS